MSDEPLPGRWLVFGVVGLALLLGSIDQTSVATALPTMQADLGGSLSWIGWTITIYSVGQIVALPIAGRLSDQFGRRTVFLAAVTVFTVTSLLAGLAGNIAFLIAARAVQGLAAGAIMPAATGIVAERFGRNRDRAIGLFTSIFPIGAIVGPVVGGILVTYTSWRAIFFVNLPLGVIIVIGGLLLIGRGGGRRIQTSAIDFGGIGLLTLVLVAGMTTVTAIGGSGDPLFRWGLVGGAALVTGIAVWMFLHHARVKDNAVVPMRLLRGKVFGPLNVINVLFGAGALGFSTLVPLYAEHRYGLGPLVAGSLLSVRAIAMIATSSLSVALLRTVGTRRLMLIGYAGMAVGTGLLAVPPPSGMSAELWLSITAGIAGLGMGAAAPSSNNASMHLAKDEISAIAGLRAMFRQSGGIAGISMTTAIISLAANPGVAQGYAFLGFAVLLLVALPVIFALPDHRGSW
ncbi:MFS transporter [Pseudonocardia sp. N23]|uniref:MFS transporter n=1 Tax=Pseudonocardia sp. N23 TaxID=1987376 RepID=UPI00209C5BC2|nr:MFS transporter [Pseudonocardia sp. N23]